MKNITIVGVAGGSASGKTTIVDALKEYFKNNIEFISHDFYYSSHDDIPLEERAKLNYDHPNSFDTKMMIEDIKNIKAGVPIYHPVYDYTIHTRSSETVLVKPTPVVVVEGILVLEDKELRDLMDVKIYVDTDADERLMRRILRDVKERGRSVESVLAQYRNTVKPMHEEFVEPSKKYADIIIPRGGENKTALDILIKHIESTIAENNR